MINKLLKSINYRSSNLIYFNENKDKLGISKEDFLFLKRQGHKKNQEHKIPFFGAKLGYTSPFWFLHSLDEIFVQEVYKFESKNKHPRILDVGANVGLSIVYFKMKYPEASILSFEPDPEIFSILKDNIDAFNYKGITLLNKAAWIEDSELSFQPDGYLGGQLTDSDNSKISGKEIRVKAVRLRDYLSEAIDFLKIDIEGAEHAVINDCKDSLQNVNYLFVEYHLKKNEEPHLHDMLSILSCAGFNYYIKEAWVNKQHPFVDETRGDYDMQLNISCFR